MKRNEKQMLVFTSGFLVIIAVVTILFFYGLTSIAWVIGYPGTILWTFGTLIYVVFLDSKHRWPGISWLGRMGRVMTFYRD